MYTVHLSTVWPDCHTFPFDLSLPLYNMGLTIIGNSYKACIEGLKPYNGVLYVRAGYTVVLLQVILIVIDKYCDSLQRRVRILIQRKISTVLSI